MKIYWIVSNYPHRHDVQAGIFYRFFAEELVKAGVDLTVIAPTPYAGAVLAAISSSWKRYHLSPKEEVVNGVKVYRPRYITHPDEAYRGIPHRFMLRALKKIDLEKPEIVHGFGAYPASYAAVEYAAFRGVPAVTTFIGSDVNEYPQHNERSMNRFLHIVDRSSKVLVVGAALADKVKSISKTDAEVMYMPIKSLDSTPLSKELARKTLGLPLEKFIVFYAGNLTESKGVPELCEALKQLDTHSDIFGVFAGKDSPVSVKYSTLPNTLWLGLLEHSKILDMMAAADVLVLPSHNEGIPGVIKEAGQMNLPVIATNVGGIPEILGTDRGYTILPRDVEAIRKSILHVKNNYVEATEAAQRLGEFVTANFHSSVVVKKQIAVYNEVISRSDA
ncbi:MAG TPA: glycosyltransferase [Bacteroidia bacterium]|nr:glycosyltransferase [Bacteroidia bacterium]